MVSIGDRFAGVRYVIPLGIELLTKALRFW